MSRHTRASRFLVAMIISVTGAAIFAASPHYKKGGQPVCTINTVNGTATCSAGTVAGLGNDDVRVTVSLSASAGTFCHNKGNPANIVPGQNPANATGSSTLNFSPDQIKNGTLSIPPISVNVTVATPTADTAGCPNDNNWTVTLGTVTYGPGFYTFEQPPGTVIPQLSFSF
jgi:hypothetical protein